MSGKTKKTESPQKPYNMNTSKENKQKHNSKRRKNKNNSTPPGEYHGPDVNNVEEVVKFLCSTIANNVRVAHAGSNTAVRSKPVRGYTGQNHYQNLNFNAPHQSPSSSQDLTGLFQNLQVQAPINPIMSNNFSDFLKMDLLKKTQCESLPLKNMEKVKQPKLRKTPNFTGEQPQFPKKNLRQNFNFNMTENPPGPSVFAQSGSGSMQPPTKVKPKLNSNVFQNKQKEKKSVHLGKNFKTEAVKKEKNNLGSSFTTNSQLLVKELENTIPQSETEPNQVSPQKKKTKNKKTSSATPRENEVPNCNQRVFLNSELPVNNSCEQTNPGSSQQSTTNNKKDQNQKQNSSSASSENDMKFPKYLSPEELQSLSSFGVLMSGVIRINQKNYKEAYITAPDKGMDILIEGLKDRNRALEGDDVYFVLKAKEHHRVSTDNADPQRTAVIVGIKTLNHSRTAIGSLNVMKNKNNNFALFSPRDSRLPRIRIKKSDWPEGFAENSSNFKDKLYFAKISQWNDLRYAEGELIQEVGESGDLEAETKAILLNQGLDVTPYNEALKQFIPDVSFKISEVDRRNREDFRQECVFTIDPQTAVDLDDAVSCKKLPNGNYEVGVHISDVSYFLEEGTPLDIAVSKRATTVYLVHKAFHMLPYELCQLCSLTPGEDKLSFSVLWEITEDCQIIKHRFARSIINSCAKFSYNQVQAIIDNLPMNESLLPEIFGDHSHEKIKDIIMFLHKVAVYLRNKRFSSGALRIDQKKIYFSLDENKKPIEYRQEKHEPSHQLIEEFMLLANMTVAETLNSTFPALAFLRCHPPPITYVLIKLRRALEKFGITLDIASSQTIHASLMQYSGDDKDSIARMLVLNNALAKPMARAKYYCGALVEDEVDRRHYALNVSLYTHFTSPIRRYADVMVHRLLAASLHKREMSHWSPDYVQAVADRCNKQKYAAKLAQEMSVELFMAIYIEQLGSMICEAVVCDIKDKSFDCIGLSTGFHHRLYFEHFEGELESKKEDGVIRLTIKWPKNETYDTETTQVIEMFSVVRVELKRANVLKLEAKLLRNE